MPRRGSEIGQSIRDIYRDLFSAYGPRGWWPLTRRRGARPEYRGGPRNRRQRFEVAAGAVLTQNTTWSNAARAVTALSCEGLLDPAAMAAAPRERIAALIRPSGYYNQKARRLQALAAWFEEGAVPDRGGLLRLHGIGPETADSILLYGFNMPFFVVDAYTRRVFSRLGLLGGEEPYERIRALFESSLEADPAVFNEYHALIVEHAKRRCARRPICEGCPLRERCINSNYY
ncbi:MAG: endonuclease [Candidatus Krumholzibacteria bacterium]|nr:endonuclease [Candidatus Krumholzibacteria bacterium]